MMKFLTLLVALAVFTLLDSVTTVVGLSVGCVELNPVVMMLGIPFWVVFRVVLLGGMLTVFFVGYRFCTIHFQKGAWMLQTALSLLDVFIGTVVFSGVLAISLRLIL
jgi:hypothetical protein